jgi:hypothetical protein
LRGYFSEQEHIGFEGSFFRRYQVLKPQPLVAAIGLSARRQTEITTLDELDDLAL